ncbi:MAG TPA: hypothetical protein VHT24_05835 [Pseudacidobacterium sp.]|nr:hypothetical protein [Pseudacidobacterium sp.]
MRKFWKRLQRRLKRPAFLHNPGDLRRRTELFAAATSLNIRARRISALFAYIWNRPTDQGSAVALRRWIRLLEQDKQLRTSFTMSWFALLSELDSVPLFAETGLPARRALLPEALHRIFQQLLPSARKESDTARFFTAIFSTHIFVDRFLNLDNVNFAHLTNILWPKTGLDALPRLRGDIHQALTLLATRVAGRGVTADVRQRGSSRTVEDSPFYKLIFTTETFLKTENTDDSQRALQLWFDSVHACRAELIQVQEHMEDSGVSTALVFDLTSMDASLDRMQLLAAALVGETQEPFHAARQLLNTLVSGRLEDTHLYPLIRQNLNLLARKTVEHTGHSGEHYIANTRKEYWQMWLAAAGGGLLTVFTAAIKLRITENQHPLFVEGFLIGTDYAISFLIMHTFGLVLATKQPSMTAAAFAGIVRENRGVSRWSKIADFAARICRTQLAAAFGNVIAVCVGAVVFEQLWVRIFLSPYLPAKTAKYVYETLHPFTSGTAVYAAFTGIILWLAAVIGGWCENFAIYNRIPAAIAQHPLGLKIGIRRMQRFADTFQNNISGWSTNIVLGYMLGFAPEIAHFFGIPLDVRHITLNTGMLALAATRYGLNVFGHRFYFAIAGLSVTFVLNLGVSFLIAAITGLRAYNVPHKERMKIWKYVLGQALHSPLRFLIPLGGDESPVSTPTQTAVKDES